MRPTSKPILTDSIKVTEVDGVVMERFMKADGTYCKENEKAHGVSQADTDNGEMCPVEVYGIAVIETGDGVNTTSIPINSPVKSDAFGKAVKADVMSITAVNGFAVSSANAAGIGLAIKLI